MREKRVWPPARKEADAAETVAQFEATVAVAKQTVAKSGEVLSSAKEDLSEHQRWLQLQTAAVEKDRVRHERWLQRQRERKEAAERREEAKLRRQARFQRIGAALKSAVMAVVHAITGAIGFVVGSIAAAISFVLRSIGNGLAFVGGGIRDFTLYLLRQIRFAFLWLAVKTQALFGAAGRKLVAGVAFIAAALGRVTRSAGRMLSGAVSGISATTGSLVRGAGAAVSSGVSQVSAKTGSLARSTGAAVSSGMSQVSAKTGSLARSTGAAVSSGMSQVSAKTQALASQALVRPASTASDSEDRSVSTLDDQPVSVSAIEAAEMEGESEAVAAIAETFEVPAHFRTAAERAELPSVSDFVSERAELPSVSDFVSERAELPSVSDFVSEFAERPAVTDFASQPDIFDRSESSSGPAYVADDEAPASVEPPADLETAAPSEPAARLEGAARSEVSFGADWPQDPGGTAGSEIVDRARAFGNDAGARLAAAFAAVAAVAATLGRRAALWSASVIALASAKFHAAAPTAGERISQSAFTVSAKARNLGSMAASSFKPALSGLSAKARDFSQTAASSLKPALSGVSAKVQAIAPAFHALVTEAGAKAKHYAGAGAVAAAGGVAKIKSVRDAGKNALSLPEGVDRDRGEISRMLIIAGVLMLICGALLVGGGLILRVGAPSMSFTSPFTSPSEPAEAEEAEAVVWLYDDPERTLVERSIFTGSDGPGGIRLTGLAFSAENVSDHTLTDLHGTVKPDLKIIDFKLAIDIPGADAAAAVAPAPNTVPPRTAFMLVVPFPREVMDGEEGVEVEDFLSDYGGLTLKVRYAVDGKERSYIQYLSPAMLRAQLAEIAGGPDSLARASE